MTKVIIIKNTHSDELLTPKLHSADRETQLTALERENMDVIARSQFKVYNLLKKYSNFPIIDENSKGMKPGEDKNREKYFNYYFPNGLPNTYSKLNFEQKKYLSTSGGVAAFLDAKQTKQIFRDGPQYTDTQPLLHQIPTLNIIKQHQLTAALADQREFLALMNVEKIAKETGSKTVLLVYGSSHTFSQNVAKCFPKLEIQFEDATTFGKNIKTEAELKEIIREDEIYKSIQACSDFSKGFNNPRLLEMITSPPQENLFTNANNANSDLSIENHAYACASFLMVGVLTFGLFKCLSSCFRKNVQSTEESKSNKIKQKKLSACSGEQEKFYLKSHLA